MRTSVASILYSKKQFPNSINCVSDKTNSAGSSLLLQATKSMENRNAKYKIFIKTNLKTKNTEMKKYILYSLFAFAATSLFAQPAHGPEGMREKKEKMNAMRAAYITTELNLRTEDAQLFWPVYNELDNKIEALRMAN